MGLYERLLRERRRGRPPGASYGSGSPVLDRRPADAPKDCPPEYAADLASKRRQR